MNLHLSPSMGQQCGISAYADKLNKFMPGWTLGSKFNNTEVYDSVLVEHEYGLDKLIDWDEFAVLKAKKVIIQHAFSPLKQYAAINARLMERADKVVFLTNLCKIEACKAFPQFATKYEVISHYMEPMVDHGIVQQRDHRVIGIHGFGFPRNGFLQLLDAMDLVSKAFGTRVYIMSSVNSFNRTAERETSIHIDKIRRRIWTIAEKHGVEPDSIATINLHYYETKEEVIRELMENCDALFHLTKPTPQYFNASGSIRTLLATGLPVFALDSIFTEDVKGLCVVKPTVKDLVETFIAGNYSKNSNVKEFTEANSTAKIAEKILALF